jgi:hypothetical protein
MRFLYGFLKPRAYGFLSGFPLFSFTMYSNCTVEICKRFCEFEEIEISRQDVEVTVNSKEENSSDFCLNFVQESASIRL